MEYLAYGLIALVLVVAVLKHENARDSARDGKPGRTLQSLYAQDIRRRIAAGEITPEEGFNEMRAVIR